MRSVLVYSAVLIWTSSLFGADQEDDSPLTAAQQSAVADVASQTELLKKTNHSIWEFAEVGLQENQSADLLKKILAEHGFDVAPSASGMPTAFVATYGSGRPIIGILAEYDALPGLSQKAVPYREPLAENAAGHACGHSGLGTAALGAALATKAAMEKHHLSGTIRLYGTPAEETLIGKIYMLLAGDFDDLDICLHWHPSDKNVAQAGSSKALISAKFTFHGLPAHSSGSPHSGRSALDAVELMNVAANYMREHIKEDARLHYVITNGGGQPNVVPPEATVWYFVRADSHEDAVANFEWLQDIAAGAAKMTRTSMSLKIDTDCHEVIPNTTLTEAIDAHLRAVGAPQFTDDELGFAARLQAPLKEQFNQTFDTPLRTGIENRTPARQRGRPTWETSAGKFPLAACGQSASRKAAPGIAGRTWQPSDLPLERKAFSAPRRCWPPPRCNCSKILRFAPQPRVTLIAVPRVANTRH